MTTRNVVIKINQHHPKQLKQYETISQLDVLMSNLSNLTW